MSTPNENGLPDIDYNWLNGQLSFLDAYISDNSGKLA
jgi:hypothetical protein